jgi:hypothetical protein
MLQLSCRHGRGGKTAAPVTLIAVINKAEKSETAPQGQNYLRGGKKNEKVQVTGRSCVSEC